MFLSNVDDRHDEDDQESAVNQSDELVPEDAIKLFLWPLLALLGEERTFVEQEQARYLA